MAAIDEVARRAGVHKSTASRVLNGVEGGVQISAATRTRVLEAAQALQYRGNPFARSLRAARRPFVGVVAESLGHPHWVALIESIEEITRRRGYHTLLSQGSFAGGEVALAGVGALLVLGDVPLDPAQLDAALARGTSILTLGTDLDRPDIPAVHLDNVRAIRLALEHLVQLGHRRIALFSRGSTWESRVRVAAYQVVLAELGLPVLPTLIPAHDVLGRPSLDARPSAIGELLEDGVAACRVMFASPNPPTAVISTSSLRAMGFLGEAHRRGLVIPRDLSLVSFDLSPLVEHTIPRLTTISQHVADQGRLAATLLLDRLEGMEGREAPHALLIRPDLTVRESTGPPPAGG